MTRPIVKWSSIAEEFTDLLLLGNGASIALDRRFSYSSLLEYARQSGLLTAEVETLFGYLDTEDFELVLSLLWHTVNVNRALGINESATRDAYVSVRNSLVRAVRANHADYLSILPHLDNIATFLKSFGTVHSLNYDLTVYWAMMESRATLGAWFKDCFVNSVLQEDWGHLRTPYRADGATLVFYPHGNLILSTFLTGEERKIQRRNQSEDLLARITNSWTQGRVRPLFVSEGTSQQKRTAIRRSHYLSRVFDVALKEKATTLTIYGFSFSDNDSHILQQLSAGAPRRIAVSVFKGNRTTDAIADDVDRIYKLLRQRFSTTDITFYWSHSKGAWRY